MGLVPALRSGPWPFLLHRKRHSIATAIKLDYTLWLIYRELWSCARTYRAFAQKKPIRPGARISYVQTPFAVPSRSDSQRHFGTSSRARAPLRRPSFPNRRKLSCGRLLRFYRIVRLLVTG